MAVRHGYGKIAGADALVFAYDTGDTRNSYKGEPTENLANTNSKRTLANYGGGTTSYADAPEKGPGWKKVTITAINGSNFRLAKFPYITQPTNTTRTYSLEIDFNGTSGYWFRGDGFSGLGPNIYSSGVHSWTFTTTTNSGSMALFLNNGSAAVSGLNDVIYYRYYQVENKAHRTPFTAGTRSATQGLLDLTGNHQLNLVNLDYTTQAMPYFDGTDARISTPDPSYPSSGTDPFTLETIVKIPNAAQWYVNGSGTGIIGRGSYGGSIGIIRSSTNNRVAFWVRLEGGNIFDPAILNFPRDVYNHVVGVYDGAGSAKIYHNGVFVAEETGATTGTLDAGGYNIGGGNSFGGNYGAFGEAEIPVAKLYNRALTAAEVAQNFNHYKSRFSI